MNGPELVSKEPIAIIGVGCVLPDAPDVPSFWANLMAGRSSIREVSPGRWDPALFWSADKSAADKTYAKIGSFVDNDAFNPLDYRMPPGVVVQIDPSQRWALSATRQAFKDAGYATGLKGDGGKEFDRTRAAVILGNAMGGELMKLHTKRLYWPQVEQALRADPSFQRLGQQEQHAMLARGEQGLKGDVPPITEDSMPGTLSNVAAGRIANLFDLSGKNFTTDAACASSLAALDAALDTLRKGEADYVVWGGTDRSMDVTPYVEFSKIGALSPDGSRPFDAGANGFVMGEGCAIFLLKRLSDAERDGDKVYAVVRGIGGSSDGKGKGITAPNPVGQVKAVVRAYKDAEMDPYTLGYIEAHGTSTPVGDPVELTSAEEAFRAIRPEANPPLGSIAVGSVKSNLGHLKSAAGAAGLLKTALALKNGVIPPSINVNTLNPRIDWGRSAFKVATQAMEWPRPATHPRRAAVSSFGFGGTNFHVVLEEHVPGQLKVRPASHGSAAGPSSSTGPRSTFDAAAFQASMKANAALEAEPIVLDGANALQAVAALSRPLTFPQDGKGPRVRDLLHPLTKAGLAAPTRVATTLASPEDLPKRLEQAQKAATNPQQARLAFQQGVFIQKGNPHGKLAFLFPGQGTQYVNMFRDLAQKYQVVADTFAEADEILKSELDGVRLTDILWPTPDTPEAQAASDKKLQLTEFTQPAVLAADVAILRLLRQWGIEADVVAGHSLGEYGALVAAGVLTFGDALHAVAARGREMAHVEVPDLGKMASVSGDWHAVQDALKGMTEYVIPANKNCPSQTVIAGSSKGVDEAVRLLQQKGLQAQYLPVSAAFHSAIVAPASKPLRKVLGRLDVKSPKVRVLSNVGAQPYQDDPDWIRDNLATQVASPVEWIEIVERMYDEGVRTFIEVGPKLALTNFVRDILKEKPDAVAIGSNHPKKGGITHANELFAFLGAWGYQPNLPALDDPKVYTAQYRDPAAEFRSNGPAASNQVSAHNGMDDLAHQVAELRRAVEEIRSGVSRPTQPQMAPIPQNQPHSVPSVQSVVRSGAEMELQKRVAAFGFNLDDIGVSGVSMGLPGMHKPLFADDNIDRILRGENLIDTLPPEEQQKMVDKTIVRLQKGTDGSAQFQAINDIAQVIHLAGRRGGFDIAAYGVDKDLADSLDRSFQYAIAAGIEALKDAGIPLVRTYLQTSQGGWLPKEWKLPEPMRDETGIIFASAFPGYDNLLRDVTRYLTDKYAGRGLHELHQLYAELIGVVTDPDAKRRLQDLFERGFAHLGPGASRETHYEFNRKFLFNVLSMGHSQLAQFIGARGPNTQVNAACASTTQALAIAEDWIRTGRCKRVLVVGADDVTSDAMFEWIGSGFLASGAATTTADVTQAALPFDRRRHGMIVGMGAVGLVLETVPETERRGMRPIARLLATRISNSAFHGSRLDVGHIADEMRAMMARAEARYGLRPAAIAAKTVFMSHETYTPARGGSASAEIHALRATFGADANKVVVANTKGFTGHPQGAGVEDAIVLRCLQRGRLPPIANFREPDPELGDLNLSKGGAYDVRYSLRLAAGFGSQVGMSLMELVAREDERVADAARYQQWLADVSGQASAKTEVVNRTLRIVDQGPPARKSKPDVKPVVVSRPAEPQIAQMTQIQGGSVKSVESVVGSSSGGDALESLIQLVAQKTGYPRELLDPNLDMEADLGIDTVKQAEIFGAIREAYGLPQEDGIQIKDYPTLAKVAGYVQQRIGGATHPHPSPQSLAVLAASPRPEAIDSEGKPMVPSHSLDEGVLQRLIQLVSQKTGYPVELLDPNLDMEADLGIDTVKQAELFGAIREAYSLPPEEGIQIKDYPTLAKVAGYVQTRLGSAAAPPSEPQIAPIPQMQPQSVTSVESVVRPAPKPAAQGNQSGNDPEAVLQQVIRMVAAKTGYPAEMLEPDLDMEADLGIDTVKQAELFGEVRATYGIPLVEGLLIKDYPTLRKVAGFVLAHAPQGTQASPSPTSTSSPSPAILPPPPPALTPARPVIQHPAPPHATAPVARASAATSPAGPSARSLPQPAQSRSQSVQSPILRRIPLVRPAPLPEHHNELRKGTVLLVGEVDTSLAEAFVAAGWKTTTQPGQPIVGLLAVASRPGPTAQDRIGPLFDAAKAHRAELTAGSFVCVVTRQDGAHGLQHVRDASMAALAGLGKAFKKEFPQALTKVLDIHPEGSDVAGKVLAEVQRGGPRTEVSYGRDGARFVVEVAPQSLPEAELDVAGKGLVVSGGAQGITVELLAALAPQHPRLLLLGRTDLPEEAGQWAALDEAGWKRMEASLIEDLKAKGERVTPVTIQKALSPRQKAADVHRNLARLQDLGATVLYAPIDVTDAKSVSEAVGWARSQWGKVDGVIHAAGVEISKDLASKDRAQFDSVFNVKAKGWDALMAATRDDKLEVLMAFGSVAGRFGNVGQTDYSAANEYLCKAVKAEAVRRKALVGATIAWGPWGEVGMATKGSILQIMHASGVTPIPTASGVAMFLREMAQPGVRECVVAGELGAIDADGQVVEKGWDLALAIANQVLADHAARFRLLESIDAVQPDHSLEATVLVDQGRDPGLRDHRVDGVPYLPGVFGLEAFAEAGLLLAPKGAALLGAEDLRFSLPLKQLKAAPAKGKVTARVTSRPGAAVTTIHCALTSQFLGPDGRAHGEPKTHFEGTLRFGTLATSPRAPPPHLEATLRRPAIYPPFFHGPSFQVLDAAGPLAPEAVARFREPTETHFGKGAAEFAAHPMLVEALFQVCGLQTLVEEKAMSLPAGIQRLESYHTGPLPPQVHLRGQPKGRDAAGNRLFDAEAVSAQGMLLLRLTGYAMVETGPAPQAPTPPEPALPLPEVAGVRFAAEPVRDAPLDDRFTAAEKAQHARFTVPKRAQEWRAGRLAAKQAVAQGRGARPADVEVRGDESGRPRLFVAGREAADLHLSLTHRDGLAVAAVSEAPVGIDLEPVEAKPQSFLEEAFGIAELKDLLEASARGEDIAAQVACLWTAKEAALKRAGVGLRSDLRAHEVTPDEHGGAVVVGPATGRMGVRFFGMDGKVLAVSAPSCDPRGR
ncbi:MAG TPA: SDR family NAD(P)-dependent oxidoreductase [Candidatus Thermoplasmatota archaeon]|nr:SDR family NAD(P)-dependent oxidoreductase [Candidatus Thermoplasmatota archaeon]